METPVPKPAPAPELPQFLKAPVKLRPDCRLILQKFRGTLAYVLEDTRNGRFFQIGLREEMLVRKLDGSRTGEELLKEVESVHSGPQKDLALDPKSALHLLATLHAGGLLENSPPPPPKDPGLFKRITASNPLFLKIPLTNPDTLLKKLSARVRWIFSPLFAVFLVVLGVAGVLSVASDWQRFTDRAQSVLSSDNWFWLILTFVVLKVVHELGHGITCRFFGGRVPEFGLYFFFFTPLTYVDATSSWAFPSKAVRILVSSAGMIAELSFAAMAAIVWANTDTGVLNTVAYNAIVSATIVTLLFNLNPLLRFDGYFILSDLVGIPNLYSHAGSLASAWIRKLVFGIPPEIHDAPWIGIYGLLCMAWRWMIAFSISVAAIVLLQGVGLILVILYLAGMLWPVLREILKVPKGRPRVRGLISAAVLLLIAFFPIRPTITSTGVLEPAGLTPVRVECPGFLREIFVKEGEFVEKGRLLARLDNPEESAGLQILETELALAEARAHAHRLRREPREEARENELVRSLQARVIERQSFVSTLEIHAPQDGVVLGDDLSNLQDAFLQTGYELFAIGDPREREIKILIPEDYGRMLEKETGETLQVFLRNQSKMVQASWIRLEPRATREIRHPQATAIAAGPIPVQRSTRTSEQEDGNIMEMTDPHFLAVAALNFPPNSAAPRSGETCQVRLDTRKTEPLAVFLYNSLDRAVRRKIAMLSQPQS